MRILIATCAVALALVPSALAKPAHGFRDPQAPRAAEAYLNALPQVDGMRCHWKVVGHTIGCIGMVKGFHSQIYFWSVGSSALMKACALGTCLGDVGHTHPRRVFGRPY